MKEIHEHIEVVGSVEGLFVRVCCFRRERGYHVVATRRDSLTVAVMPNEAQPQRHIFGLIYESARVSTLWAS